MISTQMFGKGVLFIMGLNAPLMLIYTEKKRPTRLTDVAFSAELTRKPVDNVTVIGSFTSLHATVVIGKGRKNGTVLMFTSTTLRAEKIT